MWLLLAPNSYRLTLTRRAIKPLPIYLDTVTATAIDARLGPATVTKRLVAYFAQAPLSS